MSALELTPSVITEGVVIIFVAAGLFIHTYLMVKQAIDGMKEIRKAKRRRHDTLSALQAYIGQGMDDSTAYQMRRREMEGEWRRLLSEEQERQYRMRVQEWTQRQRTADASRAYAQMNYSMARAGQALSGFYGAIAQDEAEDVARRMREVINTEESGAAMRFVSDGRLVVVDSGAETDVPNSGTVVDEAYAQQMIQEGERAAQAIFRAIRPISPAEWEEARRQSQEKYEQAKQAEERALSLLVEHLNNNQATHFKTYKYFWAEGSHTKGKYTYRIVPDRHNFQVDIYTADKKITVAKACAEVKNHNRYDSALAAKMMIENYEPGFFISANLTPELPIGCTAEECLRRIRGYQNEMKGLWLTAEDPYAKRGVIHG